MTVGEKAKKRLEEFVPEINAKVEEYFDMELRKEFGFNAKQKQLVRKILEHSREFLLRKQKKIRPAFVYCSYLLGSKEVDEKVWQAALGVDLVADAAILMHDDFMDRDDLRRGGLSTHAFFREQMGGDEHVGDVIAVNVGDAMLCLGFELVVGTGNTDAAQVLMRGIANTAFGQAYDISLEAFGNWTEEDVLDLHRAKTAIYTYENPLFVGAHLAGLPKPAFEVLREYSRDGGVAFQLQDDILGVFGDPGKTGKSADSDLKQGKCTLLVLKALDRPEVRKVWGNRQATREELDRAKQAIVDCGSYDYSKKLAAELAAKAAKTAEKLRGLKLNPDAIDYIQGVAEYMVTREV